MASRAELMELFGPDGVITAPQRISESLNPEAVDTDSLVTVGLPCRIGGIYTAHLTAEPDTFSIFPATVGDDPLDLIVLGAPNPDSSMRYLLDTKDGYVVLVDLESEHLQLETINESVDKFIEYLYRIGRFRSFKKSPNPDRKAVSDYKELLSTYLVTLDAFAMKKPTSWWSMVFDRAL